jgi:hypothetical protein
VGEQKVSDKRIALFFTCQENGSGNLGDDELDCLSGLRDARAEIERLKAENRILRGLVQTNPDWKCPHRIHNGSLVECPLGFPGCACADDRIAVLCEDSGRIFPDSPASAPVPPQTVDRGETDTEKAQ